jgi:hypothetical protein
MLLVRAHRADYHVVRWGQQRITAFVLNGFACDEAELVAQVHEST